MKLTIALAPAPRDTEEGHSACPPFGGHRALAAYPRCSTDPGAPLRKPTIVALLALVIGVSGCGLRPLTDADLVRISSSSFDKRAMEGKHVRLGRHMGTAVVADFPCADLCPQYTVRIIHYDVEPGPSCSARGGKTVLIGVPIGGSGLRPTPYCVPRVLAERVERLPLAGL